MEFTWSFGGGQSKKTFTVLGFSLPPDADLIKCGLCKAVMLRDDFGDHVRWESTLARTDVDDVEKLLGP